MFVSDFDQFVAETSEDFTFRYEVVTVEGTVDIFEGFFNHIGYLFFGEPTVVVEGVFLALVEGIANDEEEVEMVAGSLILGEALEEDVFSHHTATKKTDGFLKFGEEFSMLAVGG